MYKLMAMRNRHRIFFLFKPLALLLAICLVFPLAACGRARQPEGRVAVDELFQDFYKDLGGEERLGAAISPVVEHGDILCQFTYNAMMCYNRKITGLERYYLEAVGAELNVRDEPQPYPEQHSSRVVDGYPIYPDFIPLYDTFFGSLYAGRPLTNPRYNYEEGRVEQYFEKLGFYHNFDEPEGAAHLLEYGAYVCGEYCRVTPRPFIPQAIQSPFIDALDPLGGTDVFGKPISDPTVASDGYLEQIFENVVVYAPADDPTQFRLRPLPFMVGIPVIAPGPKMYDYIDNVIFYATDGEMGYHVPIVFDDFIASHGGLALSGKPLSDPSMFPDVVTPRQCFENYCIDYYADAEDGRTIRLAPLGVLYLETIHPEETETYDTSRTNVAFLMNEEMPQIGVDDEQTITVVVYQKDNGQPVANIEARLVLTASDGSQYTYTFPPTDADGLASLTIAPVAGASRGDLVLYEICLNVPIPPPCETDAFLIWD